MSSSLQIDMLIKINSYQEIYNQQDTSLKIHLNASDDRGIEVIRSQINNFVNTKRFFTQGLKFVILDEGPWRPCCGGVLGAFWAPPEMEGIWRL